MSEPGFGEKEPPPSTPEQMGLEVRAWSEQRLCRSYNLSENGPPLGAPEHAGLRIASFVRIDLVSESGFGEKEPPPGTPEHTPPRTRLRKTGLPATCFR